MLYISRLAGEARWYVKDTDDGSEELASITKLRRAVRSGVVIEGVETYISSIGNTIEIRSVNVVTMNQPVNKAQVKAKVISGVDVRVADGAIVAVGWKPNNFTQKTSIRLSDFCDKCGNFIFSGIATPGADVFIILDDKISFTANTFRNIFRMPRINVDVTAVSKESKVKYVYDEYFNGYNGEIPIDIRIIDSPERKELFKGLGVVYHGSKGVYAPSAKVNAGVIRMMKRRFKTLESFKFIKEDYVSQRRMYSKQFAAVFGEKDFWRSHPQDFALVYSKSSYLSSILWNMPTIDYNLVRHFFNFLKFFEPDDTIKQIYVNVCNRTCNWLIDMEEAR